MKRREIVLVGCALLRANVPEVAKPRNHKGMDFERISAARAESCRLIREHGYKKALEIAMKGGWDAVNQSK